MFENHWSEALLISYQRSLNSIHMHSLFAACLLLWDSPLTSKAQDPPSLTFSSICYPQLLSTHHLNISKTVNLTHNTFILMTYTVIFIVVLPEGFIHILYIQFLPPPTYSTPNHSTETVFTNVAKLNEDLSVLSFWPHVNAYSALKSQTLISLI